MYVTSLNEHYTSINFWNVIFTLRVPMTFSVFVALALKYGEKIQILWLILHFTPTWYVHLKQKYEGLPKNRFKAHIPDFASLQHWT